MPCVGNFIHSRIPAPSQKDSAVAIELSYWWPRYAICDFCVDLR